MNKKKLIDAIIALNVGYAEADRKNLEVFNDKQIEVLHKSLTKNDAPPAPASAPAKTEPTASAAPKDDGKEKPAANEQKKVVTLQEYIAAAPPQVAEVLRNGMEVYDEEKKKLISEITGNENNAFTAEELQTRPLGELRKIAKLSAKVPTGNRGGLTPVATYTGQAPSVTANTSSKEEPMDMPTMNFETKKS